MANNNRIGGLLAIMVDGKQYEARGNFQITGMTQKRTGVAGQDGVHGFIAEPIVPSIKGDWSIGNQLSLVALEALTDVTAQVNLANGMSYILTDAWTVSAFVIDAHDGKVMVELEGMTLQEMSS
jgi:hypothetical protein